MFYHYLTSTFFVIKFVAGFQCSSDPTTNEFLDEFQLEKNSMGTKHRSIESLFIFDRPCYCEYDWKAMFCSRLNAYRKMNNAESPTVCVCRQFDGLKSGCLQFLTRCFPSWEIGDVSRLASKAINPVESCKCCFNQPDDYCHQLECKSLKPSFESPSNNTSCLCYTQSNYPDWICNAKKSNSRMKNNHNKVRLYDSLSADDSSETKKSWPYKQKVAFVEEINLKRRIQDSSSRENQPNENVLMPKRQSQQQNGVWLGENIAMLPMLVATCVVLLGLTGFGCFLIVVTRIQTKNEQNTTLNGDHSKRHYEKNGSPKTSAIILQNKLEQNAIRLTHSVSSPKNQLLKPPQTVKFAPLPRTKELCELDYLKPCNCKHSTVSVNV